jgi:hypothetical protein
MFNIIGATAEQIHWFIVTDDLINGAFMDDRVSDPKSMIQNAKDNIASMRAEKDFREDSSLAGHLYYLESRIAFFEQDTEATARLCLKALGLIIKHAQDPGIRYLVIFIEAHYMTNIAIEIDRMFMNHKPSENN